MLITWVFGSNCRRWNDTVKYVTTIAAYFLEMLFVSRGTCYLVLLLHSRRGKIYERDRQTDRRTDGHRTTKEAALMHSIARHAETKYMAHAALCTWRI